MGSVDGSGFAGREAGSATIFRTPYGGIAMREAAGGRLGDVAVLGVGKSGLGAARYCLRLMAAGERVSSVTVYPGAATARAAADIDALAAAGARIVPDEQKVSGRFDLAIASPGIPQPSEFYQSALACAGEVITEPELAWRESPWGWVAVTGTNGKTTTTSLIADALARCGIDARPVGNIGSACIDAIEGRKPGQLLVAELSSFQLASMPTFSPEVAILLNITPDHVEWHGSLEAYAEAKRRVFANLRPDALGVVDADDPGAAPSLADLRSRGLVAMGVGHERAPLTAACVDGRLGLAMPGHEWTWLGPASGLQIKGEHNERNALAAACALMWFGIPADKCYEALCAFPPIEHRIEPVATVDGVLYVNDSKATNTDATAKALTAFDGRPLIVLLGGHDKMTDLTQLVEACSARCKAVVCFGAAGPRFAQAFAERADAGSDELKVIKAGRLAEALEAARHVARPGDVVALSPACSSFDEFSSFEERGRVFKQLVADLEGRHE